MGSRSLAAILASLVVGGVVLVAQPADQSSAEELAQRAAARLEALREEADRLAREQSTLLGDLRRLELDREMRGLEFARARVETGRASRELAEIDSQATMIAEQAKAALPDLNARLVTLYKLGRGQYARLMLSASDARSFAQAARLVSALADQDRQRIAMHQARMAELAAARSTAQQRQEELRGLEAEAARASRETDRAIAAHAALVRDIDSRRDLNARFAAELLASQQRLQAVIAGLASADSVSLPIDPFKGDLDWPVPGTLRRRFGAAAGSRPAARGIEIGAPEGAAVHAVHDGSVAFAGAFAGFGRLVIVDHGNQTFTLYGNLADVEVQRGARVRRGEAIGTVGLARDGTAGIYFELRIDGQPVDPLQWLTPR